MTQEKVNKSVFDDLYDTESYIKQLVIMHDYDKWDNGTYKGNMHTIVPAIMETIERDKIKDVAKKEGTPMQIEVFREFLLEFYSKMYACHNSMANDKIVSEFTDRLVYLFHTDMLTEDKQKLLVAFGKWYGFDEMQREKPETWKSIVGRFLDTKKGEEKELKNITEEDAEYVASLHEIKFRNNRHIHDWILDAVKWGYIKTKAYQYLQSKNYKLPKYF